LEGFNIPPRTPFRGLTIGFGFGDPGLPACWQAVAKNLQLNTTLNPQILPACHHFGLGGRQALWSG